MNLPIQLLVFCFVLKLCSCWIVHPGPVVIATRGELWPKPQKETKKQDYYVVSTDDFYFNIISENCSLLTEAALRYSEVILAEKKLAEKYSDPSMDGDKPVQTDNFIGYLKSLDVSLKNPCTGDEYPDLDMDESYTLTIQNKADKSSSLEANSIWGILRGIESFSQSIYLLDDDNNLYINVTEIKDYPRFKHRGVMLDTARHYLSMDVIYKHIDALAYNKMNVFHWHIVDDQSFPYQSDIFPELSDKGAYHPRLQIYTATDIQNIIEYSRLRGIRVIPEFDAPGHVRSWGDGVPELLSTCYEHGKATDLLGPMDPSKEFVFSFMNDLYDEIVSRFPQKYVHVGGDEVQFDCWKNNPSIKTFMQEKGIFDYQALQKYFMEKMLDMTTSKDITALVWEEVYKAGIDLPANTITQVWYSDYKLLNEITKKNHRAIYSSCWYLDHLQSGGDWDKFYNCDPQDFGGSSDQLELLLGGEACMWAEVVNNQNALQRTWPRASATAEKLWSAHKADKVDSAKTRLEEHYCRMNRRGIPTQPPNGAGYCLY